MTGTFIRSSAAMLIAVILSLTAFFSAPEAKAQTNVTVHNHTLCTVHLCVYDAGGAVLCFTIPGGGGPVIITFPPFFNPIGVVSAGGIRYPFNPPPPGVGCTPCISLPTPVPPPCCAIVCYDPNIPAIFIHPCGAPCLP